MALIDLTGQTFGRLSVIERGPNAPQGKAQWYCECACIAKTIKLIRAANLRNGESTSCGCFKRESTAERTRGKRHGLTHGRSQSPVYISWSMMKNRCTNPQATGYQYYGGRGISICDRWTTFEAFLEDMGERPEGTSIDRINNEGNYEPTNCRWATPIEQNNNRRKMEVSRGAPQ